MAYATPTDWTLAVTPSHTQLNQDLIDSPLAMRSMFEASAKVFRSSNMSISSGNRVSVSWTSNVWQVGGVWTAGDPTRLFAPVDGVYLYTIKAPWTPNNVGRRGVGYELNGSLDFDLQFQSAQSGASRGNGADLILMSAGNSIQATVYQSSGGALNLLGGAQKDVSATLTLKATTTTAPVWTPPRTWANGDKGLPWRLNTQFRDNLLNRRYFNGYGVKLTLAENLSISSGQRAGIPWDVEEFQVGDMWTSGPQLRARVAGWYGLLATVEWRSENATSTGAFRGVGYTINDQSPDFDLQKQSGVTAGQSSNGKALVRLEQGDTIQVYAYHDATESLTINGDPDRTKLCMWLEAATP